MASTDPVDTLFVSLPFIKDGLQTFNLSRRIPLWSSNGSEARKDKVGAKVHDLRKF